MQQKPGLCCDEAQYCMDYETVASITLYYSAYLSNKCSKDLFWRFFAIFYERLWKGAASVYQVVKGGLWSPVNCLSEQWGRLVTMPSEPNQVSIPLRESAFFLCNDPAMRNSEPAELFSLHCRRYFAFQEASTIPPLQGRSNCLHLVTSSAAFGC